MRTTEGFRIVLPLGPIHPEGESKEISKPLSSATIEVDRFDGKVHVERESDASVTPVGQLIFIQFLKTGYRFESWVEDCPLACKSNNAPKKLTFLTLFCSQYFQGISVMPMSQFRIIGREKGSQ